MLRVFAKIWHWVIVFLFCFSNLIGQPYFERLSIEDGLSNNSIRDILQDSRGFLWFGTLSGLNRYDGNKIKEYKVELGNPYSLANDRIVAMHEDGYGYIWSITFDGSFNRFDPRSDRFININSLIPQSDEFLSARAIVESSPGVLWLIYDRAFARAIVSDDPGDINFEVIHASDNLSRYEIRFVYKGKDGRLWLNTGDVMVLQSDTSSLSNKASLKIIDELKNIKTKIVCEVEDGIWFGTDDYGVWFYSYDSESLGQWGQGIISNISIKTIISGANNHVFIFTEKEGIVEVDENRVLINHFIYGKDFSDELDLTNDITTYIDRKGYIWIATVARGVTMFDPVKGVFIDYSLDKESRKALGDSDKAIFFEDSEGNFWITIYAGGLYLFDYNSKKFTRYSHDPKDTRSLSSNYILSILEDNSHNLWIATFQGGLNKLGLTKYNFTFIQPTKGIGSDLQNEVRSMIEDSYERLWIGTRAGKIICYNQQNNIIFTLPDDIKGSNHYDFASVYSLLEDSKGNMWVGTKGSGLFRLKGLFCKEKLTIDGFNIDHFMPTDDVTSLAFKLVYSLCEDDIGQIWIGTYNGGLDLIETPEEEIIFKHFKHEVGNINSLSDDRVRHIYQDSKRNLWVSTTVGLNLLKSEYIDSKNKKFINLLSIKEDRSSLSNNDVLCVLEDKAGRIWIATYGGGLQLLRYDEASDKYDFAKFTRKDGLPSDIIFSLLEDENGNLWMGTNNGLGKFIISSNKIERYLADEGIGDNFFSEEACVKKASGKLVFGQKRGFVSFYPDSIVRDKQEFPIVITGFKIFDEQILPGDDSPLKQSIETTREIHLNYNQNFLEIEYAILDFTHSEQCQYEYYLEGLEKDWKKAGNKRTAIYTNLDPNDYVFRLRATNHDGYMSENVTELRIHISPPWWETWGFRIVVILIVIACLAGFYLYRISRLKRQKVYLEKLVAERTQKIVKKNRVLAEQAEILNHTNKELEERQIEVEAQSEEIKTQKDELQLLNEHLSSTNTLLKERQQQVKEQTEELRTQANELSNANIELKKLNATKDKFFSLLAHDLRVPFNSILGFSSLAVKRYDRLSEEKRRQYTHIIHESVNNTVKLLENLLQWAKTQTGNIQFAPEKLQLPEMINTNLDLVKTQLEEKNLKVNVSVPDDTSIYADKNMLNTVLRNLINNAVKFTERGNIDIKAHTKNNQVEVSVKDTGKGIHEKVMATLFKVGKSRSSQGTRGEQGTGLGLIICKEFVEKCGGTLKVKSKLKEGTEFIFTMPSQKD